MSDVPTGAPASPSDLDRAIQLHARGHLDAAAVIYSDLLNHAPGDARLLTQLGLVRLQQGRLDDAAAWLDRAVAADPAAADGHAWRGEVLRQRNALQPAIEAFRTALARNADFAPALFNLALAEVERGNAAAARQAWQRFSELRPADSRVCRELGRLAYERSEFADAAHWFGRQFERTPDGGQSAGARYRSGCESAQARHRDQRRSAARRGNCARRALDGDAIAIAKDCRNDGDGVGSGPH